MNSHMFGMNSLVLHVLPYLFFFQDSNFYFSRDTFPRYYASPISDLRLELKGFLQCWEDAGRGDSKPLKQQKYPQESMGLVYLPTWMVDFYGTCR